VGISSLEQWRVLILPILRNVHWTVFWFLQVFSSLERGMCRSNILVQKSSHRAGLSVEKGAERCIEVLWSSLKCDFRFRAKLLSSQTSGLIVNIAMKDDPFRHIYSPQNPLA
jgi:hypothetical protein